MAMKKYWLSLFLCVTISALAIENLRLPDVRARTCVKHGREWSYTFLCL